MNDFQITLLGTGGGYGESVVVKLCDQNWFVIDSCVNPYSKEILPLKYLEDNNVDLENDVKLIVCSHWHDDHIKGLDVLLDKCKNAKFVFAVIEDFPKYLKYLDIDSRDDKGSSSTTTTFMHCMEIIKSRKGVIVSAQQDKLLMRIERPRVKAEVFCLTPTDDMLKRFQQMLPEIFKDAAKSNIRLHPFEPNDIATVLMMEVNGHVAILGGDLEEDAKYRQWTYILDNSVALDGKSFSMIKIPHHGSETGFSERLWTEFACDAVTACMTSFNHGKVHLPMDEMVERYKGLATYLYLTVANTQKITRGKTLDKAIKKLKPSLTVIPFNYGEITSHINLNKDNAEWETIYNGSVRVLK